MAQQTSPFIDAKFGWAQGESNWNFGMDENLLKFSYLFDRNVDGIVSSLPAAVNGEAYFLTTDNMLYFAANGSFSSCPTPKWFIVRIRSTGEYYEFNGTTINQIDGPTEIDSRFDAVELSVTGLQNKTRGFLHTSEFDLLGDGSDETVKVQTAVTAAISQGKQLIGDRTKTYKVTSPIVGGSNCFIKDLYLDCTSMTGLKTGIVFSGSLGANSLLTLDTAAEAFTATVTNGALFAQDEWVLLHTETSYYPYPGYNVSRGEWLQIRSIAGNVITFTTPIVDVYTVAAGGTLHKCSFVENIQLDNVRATGSGVAASGERGVVFRFARFFEVKNCVVNNIDFYAIELNSCIKFEVHSNTMRGTFYDGVTGTVFYGIAVINSNQYFNIHHNQGGRVRHLVIVTAESAGQGRYGQGMFGLIADNISEDSMSGGAGRSYAYENHGTGRYIWWNDNIANGCYAWMRIEGGSDIHVRGGGCNGYAAQGLILGGAQPNVLQRISVKGFSVCNWTGEVAGGVGLRIENSVELSDIEIEGEFLRTSRSNLGTGISIATVTTLRNVTISPKITAGSVESTGICISTATGTPNIYWLTPQIHGFRGGFSLSGDNNTVQGGLISNFATGGTGFGLTSAGANLTVDGTHFANINTPINLTAASSSSRVRFTQTGAVAPTPVNAGTGNTGWEIINSVTYDPPSLADGAGVTTTVTVTGAALGDFVIPTFSLDLQGITLTAYVSAANTVSCRFQNESGGVLDLASGTLKAKVIKS